MNVVRCPIVELRQYTLHPGQRDVLISLFDRALVESQEELGMTILGQFRDLDNPDRFVWLRASIRCRSAPRPQTSGSLLCVAGECGSWFVDG